MSSSVHHFSAGGSLAFYSHPQLTCLKITDLAWIVKNQVKIWTTLLALEQAQTCSASLESPGLAWPYGQGQPTEFYDPFGNPKTTSFTRYLLLLSFSTDMAMAWLACLVLLTLRSCWGICLAFALLGSEKFLIWDSTFDLEKKELNFQTKRKSCQVEFFKSLDFVAW